MTVAVRREQTKLEDAAAGKERRLVLLRHEADVVRRDASNGHARQRLHEHGLVVPVGFREHGLVVVFFVETTRRRSASRACSPTLLPGEKSTNCPKSKESLPGALRIRKPSGGDSRRPSSVTASRRTPT